jgi:uncharacterized damage-inducible protein DinB
MKNKKFLIASLSVMAICFLASCSKPATPAAPSTDRVGKMIADWERARKYTLAYLDSADDHSIAFKVSDKTPRTFGGQLLHLAEANYGLVKAGTGRPNDVAFGSLEANEAMKTKADVSKAVLDSYDYVIAALKEMNDSQLSDTVSVQLFPGFKPTLSREDWINKAFEHQTHHRGQGTQYLRAQGKTPPQEMLF